MTGKRAEEIVIDLAEVSKNAGHSMGVTELEMSKVRDYVLRYPNKRAMAAHQSLRDAVAYDIAIAAFASEKRREEQGVSPVPAEPPPVDDDPTNPTATVPLDPRGARR